MALEEFGRPVEIPQVSEFAGCTESYIDSPEYPPLPDEFAYPGTVGTSSDRKRKSASYKAGLLYYAAAASAIAAIVAVTNGFTNTTPITPQTPDEVVVPGVGTITDIEGDEGDPAIYVNSAVSDGETLYYSYVVGFGEHRTPVAVDVTAYDEEGNTANPVENPDIWEGSRSSFEYEMDVSDLEGDITLVFTGTFEVDGEDKKIVKVVSVDDMAMIPEFTADLVYSDPMGEWTNITFDAFFLMNMDDPHMMDYDLEVTSFTLNWYDAEQQPLGGGAYVWEPDTVPEKDMLASVAGYMFSYMGPAHTDNAPDNALYYSVNLIVTDNSTGKRYTAETEPAVIPTASSSVDYNSLFAEHPDWYNASTGDYLHFGASQGYRVHDIGGSTLFFRFTWTPDTGNKIKTVENYHLSDTLHSDEIYYDVEVTDNGGTLTDSYGFTGGGTFEPVSSVDYEGFAYMRQICDMNTVSSLNYLNRFDTMFDMNPASFEISEITFLGDTAKMIFYGDYGMNKSALFDFAPFQGNEMSAWIDLTLRDELTTSPGHSLGAGNQYRLTVEYYGEGPMVVIDEMPGAVTHKTLMMWTGDPNAAPEFSSGSVYLVNSLATDDNLKIEPLPEGESHYDVARRMWDKYFSGVGTQLVFLREESVMTERHISDDAIIIGDPDDPANWYIPQGTVTEEYVTNYWYEIR